jgi:hypothetical protein
VDHIRASSHNGCIKRPDTWLHPYRFAKGQILFPCTAGAVHTWHKAAEALATQCPELAEEADISPKWGISRTLNFGPCGHAESKKTQKFVFRSALRPNQFSFSHSQDPIRKWSGPICRDAQQLPLMW